MSKTAADAPETPTRRGGRRRRSALAAAALVVLAVVAVFIADSHERWIKHRLSEVAALANGDSIGRHDHEQDIYHVSFLDVCLGGSYSSSFTYTSDLHFETVVLRLRRALESNTEQEVTAVPEGPHHTVLYTGSGSRGPIVDVILDAGATKFVVIASL